MHAGAQSRKIWLIGGASPGQWRDSELDGCRYPGRTIDGPGYDVYDLKANNYFWPHCQGL